MISLTVIRPRTCMDSRLARDWLPSRRSVESQMGAFLFCLSGHCRWGNGTGLNGLYRVEGSALSSEENVEVEAGGH